MEVVILITTEIQKSIDIKVQDLILKRLKVLVEQLKQCTENEAEASILVEKLEALYINPTKEQLKQLIDPDNNLQPISMVEQNLFFFKLSLDLIRALQEIYLGQKNALNESDLLAFEKWLDLKIMPLAIKRPAGIAEYLVIGLDALAFEKKFHVFEKIADELNILYDRAYDSVYEHPSLKKH